MDKGRIDSLLTNIIGTAKIAQVNLKSEENEVDDLSPDYSDSKEINPSMMAILNRLTKMEAMLESNSFVNSLPTPTMRFRTEGFKKALQEFYNENKQEMMTLIVLANIVTGEPEEDLIPKIAQANHIVNAFLFWDTQNILRTKEKK